MITVIGLTIAVLLSACAGSPPLADGQTASRSAGKSGAKTGTRKRRAAARAMNRSEINEMLIAHNRWRKTVPVPPLQWSRAAANQALAWASQLAAESCQMRHNPDPARKKRFGENIYAYWNSSPYDGWRRSADEVVTKWGEETQWYDDDTHECNAPRGKTCGHYTQLVWQYSRHVGCARARCDAAEVWVCNYEPRGNYLGVKPY